MPTEREIQDYLRRLTRVFPSDLPATDRTCPICFEPYSQHLIYSPPHGLQGWNPTSGWASGTTATGNLGGTPEYPVSVRSKHPRSRCRHIFGRRCIEMHFRSGGPWCTKCPTCREEWFEHEEEGVLDGDVAAGGQFAAADVSAPMRPGEGVDFVRIEVPREVRVTVRDVDTAGDVQPRGPGRGEIFNYVPELPQTFVYSVHDTPPMRTGVQSPTEFLRLTASEATPPVQGGLDVAADITAEEELREGSDRFPGPQQERLDNRGKLNRAVAFLERMLLTIDIDEDSDRVSVKVKEVEGAVENLWNQLCGREDVTGAGTVFVR